MRAWIVFVETRPLVAAALVWTVGTAAGLEAPCCKLTIVAGAWIAASVVWWWLRLPGKRIVLLAWLGAAAFAYAHALDSRNVTELVPLLGSSPEQADGKAVTLRGTIASPPRVDGDLATFDLHAETVAEAGTERPHPAAERMRVSIRLAAQNEQVTVGGWKRGDRIVPTGQLKRPDPARNEGGFNYRRYLHAQRIHWIVNVKGLESVVVAEGGRWSVERALRWIDAMRDSLGRRIDVLFDDREAGYMKGLLIGIRDDLDPETYRQFSELGLTHILAISGLHVAVFLFAVTGAFRLAGCTRETTLTAGMIAVPFYVVLSGSSPSVVRAGLMAMIGLYLARRHLLKDGLHVLAAALWAMLLWNPYYVRDIGFQLSFLVTAGLIVGVPRFERLWSRRKEADSFGPSTDEEADPPRRDRPAAKLRAFLRGTVAVTVVAQAVSFPVTVYYFNQFSLLSGAANLLLVPYISFLVLPLGSIAVLVAAAWPAAGRTIAQAVSALNETSFRFVDAAAEWDRFTLIWPSPPLWWIGAYYLLLDLLHKTWMERKSGGPKLPAALTAAAMAALLAIGYWLLDRLGSQGSIHLLDVGQGDAILIRTPSDRNILVDGGGTLSFRKPGEEWRERRDPFEVGRKTLVLLLKKRGVRHLDLIVVSHLDQDHIGGLQAVLEDIPASGLLFNGTWRNDDNVGRLFKLALDRGVPLYVAEAGSVWRADRHTNLEVLADGSPVRREDAGTPDDGRPGAGDSALTEANKQNERSLVLLLSMHGTRMLLTGDIGVREEERLLSDASRHASGRPLDLLKIAHHGSKTSTSAEWPAAWTPVHALISVGRTNVYGHPHPDVTHRIAAAGAALWRTDRHGEVHVEITRDGYTIRGVLGGPDRE